MVITLAQADSPVREALRERGFPWYDAPADQVKSIVPPAPPAPPRSSAGSYSGGGSGWDLFSGLPDLATLVLGVLVTVFAVLLFRLIRENILRRQKADAATPTARGPAPGGPQFESLDLADDLGTIDSDPHAHAAQLRRKGDFSGAITWLFVALLFALEQRRMIRLGKGKTGRQLVRSIVDAEVRSLVEPTLRLFEAAYYGHRPPDPAAFEVAWAQAESLLRRPIVQEAA